MTSHPVLSQRIMLLTIVFTAVAVFLIVPAAATLQSLQVGMEAPSFALPRGSGETVELSELMGERLTVVLFWSTWSKKSRQALVEAKQLWERYHAQGLAVVAINADGQTISDALVAEIEALTTALHIEFPVLIDRGLATFHDYGVIAFPTTVIIDPDRLIRYELSGYPLVAAEKMKDFVLAELTGVQAGAEPAAAVYRADKKARRFFQMGSKTLQSGRMAATAENWFKKAIEADPQFVAPHLALGRYYQQQRQPAKALDQFEQVLAKEPANAVALCEGGMLLVDSGKREAGQAWLEKAVAAGATYAPCFYHLAGIFGAEGDPERAGELLARAKELNPLDVALYAAEGAMYENRQQLEPAARAYRKALEITLSLQ